MHAHAQLKVFVKMSRFNFVLFFLLDFLKGENENAEVNDSLAVEKLIYIYMYKELKFWKYS